MRHNIKAGSIIVLLTLFILCGTVGSRVNANQGIVGNDNSLVGQPYRVLSQGTCQACSALANQVNAAQANLDQAQGKVNAAQKKFNDISAKRDALGQELDADIGACVDDLLPIHIDEAYGEDLLQAEARGTLPLVKEVDKIGGHIMTVVACSPVLKVAFQYNFIEADYDAAKTTLRLAQDDHDRLANELARLKTQLDKCQSSKCSAPPPPTPPPTQPATPPPPSGSLTVEFTSKVCTDSLGGAKYDYLVTFTAQAQTNLPTTPPIEWFVSWQFNTGAGSGPATSGFLGSQTGNVSTTTGLDGGLNTGTGMPPDSVTYTAYATMSLDPNNQVVITSNTVTQTITCP